MLLAEGLNSRTRQYRPCARGRDGGERKLTLDLLETDMLIANPRLFIKRKASAEGRAPRTMQEAFPQYPGPDYIDPTLAEKIGDVVVIALVIVAFGAVAYFGPELMGY